MENNLSYFEVPGAAKNPKPEIVEVATNKDKEKPKDSKGYEIKDITVYHEALIKEI